MDKLSATLTAKAPWYVGIYWWLARRNLRRAVNYRSRRLLRRGVRWTNRAFGLYRISLNGHRWVKFSPRCRVSIDFTEQDGVCVGLRDVTITRRGTAIMEGASIGNSESTIDDDGSGGLADG